MRTRIPQYHEAGEKVIISPATGAFGSVAVVAALAMGARVVAVGAAWNLGAIEDSQPRRQD
jgi:NADPH-dependent curcumin reductase CurA